MNYRKEKYPKNIREAVRRSEKVLSSLNFKTAKRLKDLYGNANLRKQIPKGTGLYIFINRQKPLYVGISRNVRLRLWQHGWGKIHNHATLAYLIAEHEMKYVKRRSKLDHDSVEPTQKKLRNFRVITIPVEEDDPYLLYFMEIYLSGCLKTKWNTFRTH